MTIILQANDYLLCLFHYARSHLYLIITSVILSNLILKRYRNGLRQIPGPFVATFSNAWRFNVVRKEDMPWTSIRLHDKLGPLVRIGPKHVSVASPESISVIYGPSSLYRKVRKSFTAVSVWDSNCF